jgi:pyridoxine 4-dehydrogenase
MSPSFIFQSCSYDYLKQSVDRSIKALGPLKKIDLYQPARIELSVGIEKIMETLVSFVKEGKFDHIGLSECNANTLRKAHSVSTSILYSPEAKRLTTIIRWSFQIYPISVAEIEVSPFEYGEQQRKVIATAAELNIAIAAYS